jgi:AbrB family looped-hinge helix DNA binding protein
MAPRPDGDVISIPRTRRITIPADVMRRARLASGDRVDVEAGGDGCIVIRRATTPFEQFAGALSGVYPKGHLERLRREWA